MFSVAQVQFLLVIGLLRRFDPPIVLLPDIFRLVAEGVFHASLTLIDPLLDLRGSQIILPRVLLIGRLALDNL